MIFLHATVLNKLQNLRKFKKDLDLLHLYRRSLTS